LIILTLKKRLVEANGNFPKKLDGFFDKLYY
jgi:hypothetical protein